MKIETEELLGDVLNELVAQSSPLTLWQIDCFLESIDSCRRGLYWLAWNCAADVMVDNVSEKPFPDRAAKMKELSGITIETLRMALKAAKELPVFEWANFGLLEVVPDWARKQQSPMLSNLATFRLREPTLI